MHTPSTTESLVWQWTGTSLSSFNVFSQVHVGTAMESYLVGAVLERTALSHRFTLDLLCDKAEFHYRPMLRLAIKASLPFGMRG